MRTFVFVILVASLWAKAAWADESDEEGDTPRVPTISPWIDGAIVATAGIGWLVLARQHASWARTSCPCRSSDVNPFDRFTVNQKWKTGERLADAAIALSIVAPAGLLALSAPDLVTYSSDVLLLAESVLVTGFVTQSIKTIVSRPYPYMYRPAPYPEQNGDGINYASFWSGHTAVAMAATVTFAYLFAKRHPQSGWRWVAWMLGPAVAVGAGLLQMSAGNHFPTDVLAGAAAGGVIGYLNPLLHEW